MNKQSRFYVMPNLFWHLGFTLIELVVVIGVLAILLTIVLAAINPARHFAQADNTKRKSDITAILNAVDHYLVDHSGQPPQEVTTSVQNIAKNGADICAELIQTQKYISALPRDPKMEGIKQINDCSSSYDTGYTIVKDNNNRITVATNPSYEELQQHISLTR